MIAVRLGHDNLTCPELFTLPRGQRLSFYPNAKIAVIDGRSYRVECFPAAGGQGVRFAKSTVEFYDVFIPDPIAVDAADAYAACDCKGFEAHGHCKHLDAAGVISNVLGME